jgi:hypothetical protein
MTCTNQQVLLLRKNLMTYNQKTSAAKSGMCSKTARKYTKSQKLPRDLKSSRDWSTRSDPFEKTWDSIEELLEESPTLEAKTILEDLILKDQTSHSMAHLRTLQRRIRDWRASKGPDQAIMFTQRYEPGQQSQSDFTCMNALKITLQQEKFDHLLFHFTLSYSSWSHVTVCHSESFENLAGSFEEAVFALGGVAGEHRTDNLTAAFNCKKTPRVPTDKWQRLMDHYGITPSSNNPGVSNENGVVEKRHDVLKKKIDQALLLRGSRDFESLEGYADFVKQVVTTKNALNKSRISIEGPHLKRLPVDKWSAPKIYPVKVRSTSLVHINNKVYSVPSRLIGYDLKAFVYPEKIEIFYGNALIQTMSSLTPHIDYRHLIDSLIRKPGAFERYKYQESFFPRPIFRSTYDLLKRHNPSRNPREYLEILKLAKLNGEETVSHALYLLLEADEIPLSSCVKELLDLPPKRPEVFVSQPSLGIYDALYGSQTSLFMQEQRVVI